MIYKVKMKKDDFFKITNKIISSNLEINGDEVIFEIEGGSYNILKRTNYEFKLIENTKTKVLRFLSHYGLLITGIMFLFSILYMNSYRVTNITFNRETPINDEIEYRIKSSFKTLFCFKFCNLDYDDFSSQMRKKYFEYPFINVSCKNNIISVYIADVDEVTYPTIDMKKGNIVAKKDGIVDVYYVYNGTSLVSKNKYVKEGDILIEGHEYVGGLVLGTTYDKVEITIPKSKKIYEYAGDSQYYYDLNLLNFNLPIGKKYDFEQYDSKENIVFNLFDFLSVKKIEENKKNVIIKTYTFNEALSEAKNIICEDFSAHQISDLEKIIAITNTKSIENEDEYNFTFIVKKYESIGIFSEE